MNLAYFNSVVRHRCIHSFLGLILISYPCYFLVSKKMIKAISMSLSILFYSQCLFKSYGGAGPLNFITSCIHGKWCQHHVQGKMEKVFGGWSKQAWSTGDSSRDWLKRKIFRHTSNISKVPILSCILYLRVWGLICLK